MSNILITGASSGIGNALVQLLDNKDNHLILIGRDINKLNLLSKNLTAKSTLIQFDLEDVDNIKFLSNDMPVVIDAFAHCAGIDSTLPLKNVNYSKFEKSIKVNMFSFIELIKIIVKTKNKSDFWTNVVAVSSIASQHGGVAQTIYASTKAALEASVRVLAKELINNKIRINSVSPGLVNTEMTQRWMERVGIDNINTLSKFQLSGIAEPIEIANVIEFLLSAKSSHIVGQNISIDGGGPKSLIF
jgi:NADP-dependent 3-hydroxy acid dehydrogenase YdfG